MKSLQYSYNETNECCGDFCMQFFLYISQWIIPFLIFYIVGYGILTGTAVYDSFIRGAERGITIVKGLLPTLIGLLVATGILRASGFLELLASCLKHIIPGTWVPGAVWPVAVLRLFSSSAASGLLIDIFKEYGADSRTGFMASLILSSTECLFYTMSVYFMSVRIKKTRYTLCGALFATIAGVIASMILTGV